jgi:hypothetical protein
MKVDTRNIFVFGRSRGALGLYQGLKADRFGQSKRKIAGFVGYQAQTSYQCDRFAEKYLGGTASDISTWKTFCKSEGQNRHDAEFQNAIDFVYAGTSLPVMLQYEGLFRLNGEEIVKITPQQFMTLPLNEQLHYPNFGRGLFDQYKIYGRLEFMQPPQDNVGVQFYGWQGFVDKWRQP